MTIALNFIALPDTHPAGAYRYIARILQMWQYYSLDNIHFDLYKQQHIPNSFFEVPSSVDISYINVPTLGHGVKRIIFEQTKFYSYLKPCDALYSYCSSFPLFAHCKKVFTLHDIYCFSAPQRHGFIQRTYLRLITRAYVAMSQHILTVSEFSKKEIQQYLHVPDKKLSITYNFLPPYESSYSVDSVYNGKPFFLFVGSIQPNKNIRGMVEGFVQFNTEHKYALKIVGKPIRQGDEIIEFIQQQPDVEYLGYLSDQEILHLYQHCQAVVLMSFCEGFGIPPLEGFRWKKPSLVSSTSSLPEVVGKAGITANPYDSQAICKGYHNIVEHHNELVSYTQEQLSLFNPYVSTETFFKALGIKYTRK